MINDTYIFISFRSFEFMQLAPVDKNTEGTTVTMIVMTIFLTTIETTNFTTLERYICLYLLFYFIPVGSFHVKSPRIFWKCHPPSPILIKFGGLIKLFMLISKILILLRMVNRKWTCEHFKLCQFHWLAAILNDAYEDINVCNSFQNWLEPSIFLYFVQNRVSLHLK